MAQNLTAAESVSLLFEQDITPVIGASGRTVRFLNRAARQLFGDVTPGTALRKLLPEHVALHQSKAFFATARIGGRPFTVTLSSMPGLRLFRLEPVCTDVRFASVIAPSELFSMELGLSSNYFSVYASEHADPALRHYAARLERTSEQLRRWVSNVRLLRELRNSVPPCAKQAIDCAAMLPAMLELLEPMLSRHGLRIETELPASPCPVRILPEQFEALVLNLVSNAAGSCKAGGVIRARLARGVHTASLTLHDTGTGFAEGILPELFRAYRDADLPHGTSDSSGYGLPVCFAVADAMKGSVLIESARGSGATVSVILPLCTTGKAALRAPSVQDLLQSGEHYRVGISDALTDEDYLPDNR